MVQTNIRVCCRFRPVNKREKQEESKNSKLKDANLFTFAQDGRSVEAVNVEKGNRKEVFKLDKIFDNEEGASQGRVYEYVAAETIQDVLKGYNGTIFAYGQTGAGKTHTMFGPNITSDLKGVIPRACSHIFEHILKDCSDTEWEVQCSFLEIYKEVVKDLINIGEALKVRQTAQRGVWIEGLSQHYVTCEDEVFSFLSIGEKNRTVTSTGMNETSSRSHSLFILTVTQKLADGTKRTGRLNLADLAGSESIGKTGATGNTLEEAKKINQSLSALGNCINSLSSAQKGHVPYRDSKLTFVLSDSLGGNSKTTLIICCSQHAFNITETLSTLRFAQRAKEVKNKAVVNAQRSLEQLEAMVAKITERIRILEGQIQEREKLLKEKKGEDFDLSAWRRTFNSDLSSAAPPSSSSTSSTSSPASSSQPSYSFDDEEEEEENKEGMEVGVEEEVALENLEKERELAQEEREALERGVEREKFFHDGLEEGIILEREEMQEIIAETKQLAAERETIAAELELAKKQVCEWEEKSRNGEEEREKQQQLLRKAKNIVLQLQEQREKAKEGGEQREKSEEENSLSDELKKIETQASQVAEQLKEAEREGPLLEKEMRDLTKERKKTQLQLTEMSGWEKENLEKQALLIQKQTQLELIQDRLSSFSQGEIEENAQITANFRRRCKDVEIQIEQLQRSYDSASSGLELQAEQFKEQMEERMQQKKRKFEEDVSSHTTQLAQIDQEMKDVKERGENTQTEIESIKKEAEGTQSDLQVIKEANDAIRKLIKEEDTKSLERIEQREKLREELLHLRSGFSTRARQNEEFLGKISGLTITLLTEESTIQQLERAIMELETQEMNKEKEISKQKETLDEMGVEFDKSVAALREAEEEIAAEEKIAKELEGEYDRLQAESKELMKILGEQNQANEEMDQQLKEQRKNIFVEQTEAPPQPQQEQQVPPMSRHSSIRARKRDLVKKTFMPETAKVCELHPSYTGWLKKEGGIIKNWKKRYFLLCDDYLYYFKSDSGREVSLGRIELSDCEIAEADSETNRLNSIRIFHPTKRTYFLQADTRQDCLGWLDMLQNAIGLGEPGLDTC